MARLLRREDGQSEDRVEKTDIVDESKRKQAEDWLQREEWVEEEETHVVAMCSQRIATGVFNGNGPDVISPPLSV